MAIPRTQQAAQEIKERQAQRMAQFRATALQEMNQHQVELNSKLHALSAGQDRVTRTDVRSPVRGTVKQVILNTAGGVVKPGEPILEIIPLDDTLLIEAKIKPADIAFLHPGQKAMIKITYDFSIFGGLEGSVEQISADTIEDTGIRRKAFTRSSCAPVGDPRLPGQLCHHPGHDRQRGHSDRQKKRARLSVEAILKAKENALRER